jgi:hypothetical protein
VVLCDGKAHSAHGRIPPFCHVIFFAMLCVSIAG